MPSREEAVFCKIAIKNNLLTIEQCKECIGLRKSSGKTLYEVVVEKGYLSVRMADVIMRLQARVCEGEGHAEEFDAGKTQQIDTQILDDISSELTDSSTDLKLNLTDLGETIHPDIVSDDVALPPKIIGNDTFVKNLSAEEQAEMAKLNLLPEIRKSDNVVYNVNVQNYAGDKDSSAQEPDPGNSIMLRRSDLSDAQMLALIKGEGIALPVPQSALAAQMPMQYVAAGQETIMAAVQKNMLISLLSVLALLLLGGAGIAAFIFTRPEKNDPFVIKPSPPSEITIREWPLYRVLELLDSHKTESSRRIGCEELTRRLQKDKDRSVIEPLVMTCLKDDSKTVYREARVALESLKHPDYAILLQAANTQLIAAYENEIDDTGSGDPKRSSSEMKIIYMDVLDHLGCREIVPEVLVVAIMDRDPLVRENAMDLLEKRKPEEVLPVIRGFYEKLPGDPLADRALNYFWNKCDRTKVFSGLLNVDSVPVLCKTLKYLTEWKVAEHKGRYAELLARNPSVDVKYAVIDALRAFGSAADDVVFAPFDATLKALKADLNYRKAVLEACRVIRGPNSDKILVYMVETDPDGAIKIAARDIVAKTGTASGKALLADFDKRVYLAQVNGKKARIEALVARIGNNDRAAMPELWGVLHDKAKLVDDALAKTAMLNRNGLRIKVESKYLEWGYIKTTDGKWLDPWPAWVELDKQVDAKVKAKDYVGAMNLLRTVDSNLLKNPELAKNINLKKEDVVKAGERQLIVDIDKAMELIEQDNFPGARKQIDAMIQRYMKGEVFSAAWINEVDKLDRRWKLREKEYRAWVYRPVKAGATLKEVQQQLNGITKVNEETDAWLRIDALQNYIRFTHNPRKIYKIRERTQDISFKTGTKKISDYSDLYFKLHMKKGWEGEVKIIINCGAGGQYERVVQLGGGGGFSVNLNASRWRTTINPTGENKGFQEIKSLVFKVTFKTEVSQKDDTFVELGEVRFLD